MPSAPQAKFQFVATGDDVVNAQIQAVVDKLTNMSSKATSAGQAASDGMLNANESVKLLSESLDLKIPRALEKVIAGFQGLSTLLAGAGIAGGLIAGAEVLVHIGTEVSDLYDKWFSVGAAVDDYNKKLAQAVTSSLAQVNSLEQANSQVAFFSKQLSEAQDKQASLNRSNNSPKVGSHLAYLDPGTYFSQMDERDAAASVGDDKLKLFQQQMQDAQQQYQMTVQVINAQKQLNDTTLEGLAKINADEQTSIDLANAKLTLTQRQTELTNAQRSEFNASSHKGGDLSLIPSDAGQLLRDTQVYYAQADAVAAIGKAARESQDTIIAFQGTLSSANTKADAELIDNSYAKAVQTVADSWNKIIADTERAADKDFLTLQKNGLDTTNYVNQLTQTLAKLYAARAKAITEAQQQQSQNFLTGGLKPEASPADLFVTSDDKEQMDQADKLIKLINADLQDETAQEALLKDQALQTGMSQIQLEIQIAALRNASADKIDDLTARLKNLAAAMLNGLGNPTVIAQADKLGAKVDALRLKTQSWQTELKAAFVNDFQNAFVGIVSGTETVSKAFENMGQSILEELAKVIFQLYVVKLLQSAIGGITGLFGGGSGGATSGDPFTASFFSTPIPHAGGGSFMPGQTILVGEHGPEIMQTGSQGGNIVPNSAMGGMPLQVNIHNYGPPMKQSQTTRFDGKKMVLDIVVSDLQSNGPIRQAMNSGR